MQASAAAEAPLVDLKQTGGGAYRVEGRFLVRASSETAWSVLTDYDHLQTFVPSMHSSRVKERFPDHLLLEQVACGKFLLFWHEFHLLLNVREEPFKRIDFDEVSRRDFKRYSGSWSLSEEPGGLFVRYSLDAQPTFPAPGFIGRTAMARNTRSLLAEVEGEMVRRARGESTRQ